MASPLEKPTIEERQLAALIEYVAAEKAPPTVRDEQDEPAADAESAGRVTGVLRREQFARDGRSLGSAWGRLADRVERDYPAA